ncbi:hypothetical protein F5Y04DRAFT_276196 [Hypomontagnella monticulosa]|nr:hypothetical protein F5Y04DRAFT_276196 [Hypomontagnella monticulosa]
MSSEQTGERSGELFVRKRRADGEDDDIQKNISETAKWLKDFVEQKNPNGRRVMSPETKKRAMELLKCFEESDEVSKETRMARAAQSSIEMIKVELTKRLETDKKYQEAKETLDRLNKDHFYLRYGNYVAVSCSDLRSALRSQIAASKRRAKKYEKKNRTPEEEKPIEPTSTPPKPLSHDPPSPYPPSPTTRFGQETIDNFLTKPWSVTLKTMEIEDENLHAWCSSGQQDQPPASPMKGLLQALADSLPNMSYLSARDSISFYVSRNQLAHNHIMELAQQRHLSKLLGRLEDDLKNLIFTTYIDPATKDAIKAAIFVTAARIFRTFDYDEDEQEFRNVEFWPADGRRGFIREHTIRTELGLAKARKGRKAGEILTTNDIPNHTEEVLDDNGLSIFTEGEGDGENDIEDGDKEGDAGALAGTGISSTESVDLI